MKKTERVILKAKLDIAIRNVFTADNDNLTKRVEKACGKAINRIVRQVKKKKVGKKNIVMAVK
jgi:hypothetical protein